ncbi:MAG: hypothetical protein E6J87_15510 [Deltaproteobacteria bacterium]|nr:MAG: hypothetical protein E6J87_15510 [Deltaproteobacteria bacterium]
MHDSLTGTAYGSFGGQSIYGYPDVARPTVSMLRPGLGRGTENFLPLRFLRQHGYEFDYMDLVALAAQSGQSLRSAYDLIVFVGQFEYMPTAALAAVEDFLGRGGNGFFASNEFAAYRVRLSPTSQMTTYKTFYETDDPLCGVPGSESEVAGIGMTTPGVLRETEVIGNTVWGGKNASPGTAANLPLYITPATSWLLEGTGLGNGDVLPGAFSDWAAGTPIEFVAGWPVVLPSEHTGIQPVTRVWGAFPSSDCKEWWNWNGETNPGLWPPYNGYATALYQQRASGAQVITLPSNHIANYHIGNPLYERLLLNIFQRLTLRST